VHALADAVSAFRYGEDARVFYSSVNYTAFVAFHIVKIYCIKMICAVQNYITWLIFGPSITVVIELYE